MGSIHLGVLRLCTLGLLALSSQAQEAKQPLPEQPVKIQSGVGQKTGNSWFETTEQDLGTFFNNEAAVGKYKFKNPTDKPQEWRNIQPSCTCSQARIQIGTQHYEVSGKPAAIYRLSQGPGGESREKVTTVEVGPGEAGEIEVHMDMHGVTGLRESSIDIYTTDQDSPLLKVKFRATGAVMFSVVPPEVNLNKMAWNQQREFTVQVTSPLAKDFNITGTDPLQTGLKVEYDKQLKDGVATWTIRGTFGPLEAQAGTGGGMSSGGQIRFHTDVKSGAGFDVRVMAFVEGPLEIKPGSFMALGMIRHGTPVTRRVTLEPNDGSDLQVTKFRLEKLSVPEKFVTPKATKEGKLLHIDLEVSPDAPEGLFSGTLVIELNHPAVKEKAVMFNGYVR
jgi:hypothetical protein